jgi:hypothetical protein
MGETHLIFPILVEGAILALIFVVVAFLLSRFINDVIGYGLLVIFLFIAAGAYFGFSVLGKSVLNIASIWMLFELLQVVFYGTFALLGWRRSPYWLAAGWALHPVWDFGLHYLGPGNAFTPVTYSITCVSFDLLVAAYIALVYGIIGKQKLGIRDSAQ